VKVIFLQEGRLEMPRKAKKSQERQRKAKTSEEKPREAKKG